MFKLPKYLRCCLQLDLLPVVLQEQLVTDVAGFGQSDVFNLWGCNRQCRALCSEFIESTSVSADRLAHRMQYLNSLPRLAALTVRCKALPAMRICSTSLSPLQARLKALSLTSGSCMHVHGTEQNSDEEDEEAEGMAAGCSQHTCTMVTEHLGMFLQPFHACLEQLHIDNCHIPSMECNHFTSSPLSRLSRLHTLQLICVFGTANGATGQTTLNLYGCSALRHLNFCGSSFTDVELPHCNHLVSIKCQRTKLTHLNLMSSKHLKHLHCCRNKLQYIWLHSTVHLETLGCVGQGTQPVLIGNALLSDVQCTVHCLRWITAATRQHLVRLSLRRSCLSRVWEEAGFRDLKFLRFKVKEFSYGAVDLTGCTAVELDCHSETTRLPILGRNTVHKMALKQLGRCPPDLQRFTDLQELDLTLHQQAFLNLSMCTALRNVRVSMVTGETCRLVSINVSKCSLLKTLYCDGFLTLTSLDLRSCPRLTSLTCMGSGLRRLDMSLCPLLTSLNVSHSLKLRSIRTSDCERLLDVRSDGCEKLWMTPAKRFNRASHLQDQHRGVTALGMQASTATTQAARSSAPQDKWCWGRRHSLGSRRWTWLCWLCS